MGVKPRKIAPRITLLLSLKLRKVNNTNAVDSLVLRASLKEQRPLHSIQFFNEKTRLQHWVF